MEITILVLIGLLIVLKLKSFTNGLKKIEHMSNNISLKILKGGEKFGETKYISLARIASCIPLIAVATIGFYFVFSVHISWIGILLLFFLMILSVVSFIGTNRCLSLRKMTLPKKYGNTFSNPLEFVFLISILLMYFQ